VNLALTLRANAGMAGVTGNIDDIPHRVHAVCVGAVHGPRFTG
jgi:hypothetical protein